MFQTFLTFLRGPQYPEVWSGLFLDLMGSFCTAGSLPFRSQRKSHGLQTVVLTTLSMTSSPFLLHLLRCHPVIMSVLFYDIDYHLKLFCWFICWFPFLSSTKLSESKHLIGLIL